MGDLPTPPPVDAFVRRNDPEHLALIADVRDMKALTRELVSTTARLADAAEENHRRLMGHWDDTEAKWRPGLLQTQEQLGEKLDSLAKTIETTADKTAAAAERASRESRQAVTNTVKWVGGLVSAVIVAATTAWITLSIEQHAGTISTLQGHMVH